MGRKGPQIFLSLIIFSLLSCFLPNTRAIENKEDGDIKGMFVFGSSLVDNGNNNFLQNLAKADYLPYGIDFPLGPSGRFTNGKNVIDLLGDQLKLPTYIPAFTDPLTKGKRTSHGVNYASGGSGILDETGSIVGKVMSLNEQIKKFEEVTLPDLEKQVEINRRETLLPKYLFVVGSGGNDYTLNYFLTNSNSNVSVEDFTANLTATLSNQLKRLYNLGARKFVLMSLYPIGCSPGIIARQPQRKGGCIQYLNQAAHLFNTRLRMLVDDIGPKMPGSCLLIVNAYKIVRDIINNPASKGFNDTSKACCEIPSFDEGGNGISCKRGGSTCANRSTHVYFDGLHPTEAVNIVIATKAYSSKAKSDVYPFNVKQLAQF